MDNYLAYLYFISTREDIEKMDPKLREEMLNYMNTTKFTAWRTSK